MIKMTIIRIMIPIGFLFYDNKDDLKHAYCADGFIMSIWNKLIYTVFSDSKSSQALKKEYCVFF